MATELQFAVIGWGYWGPKIARNLDSLPRAAVTYVCDMDENRLASVSLGSPMLRLTTDPAEVLASNVDAVVIATPVRTHYGLAKQALLAGKHVLVEKPLTDDTPQADELACLAEARGLTLMVGHTFQYSQAVNEVRALVREGQLGRIFCIEMERLNLGLFRNDTDVIWDLAPHDVSILSYALDEMPESVRVSAHGHLRNAIPDNAHIDLSYASGARAHIHVSWMHPTKVRRVTLIGSERMAVYDDTNPAEMVRIFNCGAEVGADPLVSYRYGATTIPYIEWKEPLRLECEDFANSIRLGVPARANGRIGAEVVRILAAAQESVRTDGAWIDLMPTPAVAQA
jgi:predicted dehydrogenase